MLKFHREILEKFKALKGRARVILYGSVAKGNYRLDSDIDIAVITESEKIKNLAEKIADDIYISTGKVISLKFISSEMLKKNTPFLQEIKKGKVIVWRKA